MKKKIKRYESLVFIGAILISVAFLLGSISTAGAFSIRAPFVNDTNFFSILFDGNVSSTAATSSMITLTGTSTVISIFGSPDNTQALFGNEIGPLNIGDNVTVSSSIKDLSSVANTSTSSLTFLPAIKIAEVRAGSGSNNLDEYVMLYNQMGVSYNASSNLFLHASSTVGDKSVPLSFATSTILDHGFFLITSAFGYSGSVSPDATYSTSTDLIASSTTSVYISTTSTPAKAIIDKVEWGASARVVTSNNTASNSTSTFANTVATSTLPNDYVLVRKAAGTSASSTMVSGGSDSNKGNGYDTRDNSNDFVLLSPSQSAVIKNSLSSKEFPFGGGKSDTTALTVMGSFPSGSGGGEVVPTDIQFIGFGMNKPLDPSTVSLSTISLKAGAIPGSGSNLCASVSYNNAPANGVPPGECVLGSHLTGGQPYTFTINGATSTSNVKDFSGNALNQPGGGQHGNANGDYQIQFTPQTGFSLTPQVPPTLMSSYPSAGSANIPTNITKISLVFLQAMSASTFSGVTLVPSAGGSNKLTGGATLSSDGMTASIGISGALSASTSYTLTVPAGTVTNANSIPLPSPSIITFTTGANANNAGPLIVGHLPNIATGVPVNAVDIHASTDSSLDPSTITSSTVKIATGGNVVPGTVLYDSQARDIVWVGNNAFLQNTAYTVSYNASGTSPAIQNVSGLSLNDNDGNPNSLYQFSFTTANTPDTTQPGVLFANANTFSLTVTFDEAVKKSDTENISNYSLTANNLAVSLSSFNNNTATYDVAHRTVTINNLSLTAGQTFAVNVSNVHDLSGNVIDPAKSSFSGTTQSSTANGGNIGVGGGYVPPSGGIPTNFSTSTFGFVPQVEVRPINTLAGFTSNYGVNLPISQQIPATTGKIILTFPSSFTLTSAALDTFSPANNDINGPGDGTVTLGTPVDNDTSHTITIPMGATSTRSAGGGADQHDMLHFDLQGIANSPVPNSGSGYTVDIRTVNGTSTLESFTSRPFFITAGGSNNLIVALTATGASASTTTVYAFSPSTGPLQAVSTAFVGGIATSTFTGIPSGAYSVSTDPIINLAGTIFVGQSAPTPVTVSATTTLPITLSATGSLASVTVNVHATAANKKVSVFAGGPQGYVDTPVTTVSGTSTATIYLPGDGDYIFGVGPQINKTFMGPPPSPDYVMPKPVQVHVASGVASITTVNFNLVSAANTITGSVKDSNAKVVASANVYAFSPQGGFGTFGQSGSDGSFSLSVSPGSYKLGANAPGFPASQEIAVIVDQTGSLFVNGATASSTSITINLSKSSTKISGSVTDGTNAVQGAQVWAYCDSTVNSNSCFGPNGHAEAQTDSTGVYNLYVGNGTWKVAAFIPGYGQQPTVTVTISGSDASNTNFQPSTTGSFHKVSGQVTSNSTGVSGATVRIEGTATTGGFYSNNTNTDSGGNYVFSSVPDGPAYQVRGFAPLLGEFNNTPFAVSATTTKDISLNAGAAVSVNLLNAPATFDAFVKFTDVTTGISNFINFHNNATGTVQLLDSATYSVDARSPGFTFAGTSISKSAGAGSTYTSSTGRLALSGAATLQITYPASSKISGSVKDASNNSVANAWVDVVNPTSGMHFGSQADTSGNYSIYLQDGSYTIGAYSPGYLPSVKSLSLSSGTLTLSGASTSLSAANLTISKATLAITGTIKTNGTVAPGALIKGSLLGGGTSVVVANTDGTYSLPVSAGSWTISAAADGFQSANYSTPVVVVSSSIPSIDINLTTAVTLAAPTAQPITPSQGGTLRNSSGNLEVKIPADALGSSANSGQIKATETSNLLKTSSAKPIGTGQDIKAYDSSNNAINTLNSNATISLNVASSSFASNAITSTSTAQKLKIGYFDSSLGDWVPISSALTYADASGVPVTPNVTLSNVDHIALTGSVSHFSVFGTITPIDSTAPASPTGIATTQSTTAITITWTAPTQNADGSALTDLMEYEIYRDTSANGSFATQINSSQVASSTTSFADTTALTGTTYYYRITAADTSGNESAKSSASSGNSLTVSSSSAGAGSSGGGGGGGGGGYTPVTTTATTTVVQATSTSLTATSTLSAPSAITTGTSAQSQGTIAPGASASGKISSLTVTLQPGSKNSQVKVLQQLLAQDKTIYPEGLATGYYGPATIRAIQRFQKKYNIVTSGTPKTTGYGALGPKTRLKILEVFGYGAPASQNQSPTQFQNQQTISTSTSTQPTVSTSTPTIEQLQTQLQELQKKLQDLLRQKNSQ